MEDINKIKEEIIKAGYQAVKELIKVAQEEIIKPEPDDESPKLIWRNNSYR